MNIEVTLRHTVVDVELKLDRNSWQRLFHKFFVIVQNFFSPLYLRFSWKNKSQINEKCAKALLWFVSLFRSANSKRNFQVLVKFNNKIQFYKWSSLTKTPELKRPSPSLRTFFACTPLVPYYESSEFLTYKKLIINCEKMIRSKQMIRFDPLF